MIGIQRRLDSARCVKKLISGDKSVREFVARENIRRFEEQLAACTDPEQRKTLSRLLETERHYLAEALADKESRPEAS